MRVVLSKSALSDLEHIGDYIFYRVMPDRVAVVRALHGAQDYEPLLFPEP